MAGRSKKKQSIAKDAGTGKIVKKTRLKTHPKTTYKHSIKRK